MNVDPRMSVGGQVNTMLDKLGLPDHIGDKLGAMIDLQRGDMTGALRNLVDLQSGVPSSQLSGMLNGAGALGEAFGAGAIAKGVIGDSHFSRCGDTYLRQDQVGKQAKIGQKYGVNWGPFKMQGRISGREYAGSFAKPIQLKNDKMLYQGRVYDNLTEVWKDAKDGKVDGMATSRQRIPGASHFPLISPAFAGAGAASQVMAGLANQTNGIFDGIGKDMLDMINKLFEGPQGAQGSQGTGGTGGASGTGGLDDTSSLLSSNMSLEDKLLILMAKLADHMDKQIEDQMKKIEAEMAKQNKGAEGDKKASGGGGGLFGKLLGGAGAVFGGPIGGMAGSALGGMLGGSGASGGSGGASGSGGSDSSKSNLQLMQTQLQQMMERRSQMFSLFTSIFKSLHDASMGIVRNTKA